MESVMTISLSKKLGETHKPRGIRNAASRIRFLVARSAKVGMEFVSIDPAVNNYLLSTAMKNRSKIKISVSKSGNDVKVTLHGAKPAAKQEQSKDAPHPKEAATKQEQAKPAKAPAEKKDEPAKSKPAAQKPAADKKLPADKKPVEDKAKNSKEGKPE